MTFNIPTMDEAIRETIAQRYREQNYLRKLGDKTRELLVQASEELSAAGATMERLTIVDNTIDHDVTGYSWEWLPGTVPHVEPFDRIAVINGDIFMGRDRHMNNHITYEAAEYHELGNLYQYLNPIFEKEVAEMLSHRIRVEASGRVAAMTDADCDKFLQHDKD